MSETLVPGESVMDTLTRLAQPWSSESPLVRAQIAGFAREEATAANSSTDRIKPVRDTAGDVDLPEVDSVVFAATLDRVRPVTDRVIDHIVASPDVEPLSFAATLVTNPLSRTLLLGASTGDIRHLLDYAAELSIFRLQMHTGLQTVDSLHSREPRSVRTGGRMFTDDPQAAIDRMRAFQTKLRPKQPAGTSVPRPQ